MLYATLNLQQQFFARLVMVHFYYVAIAALPPSLKFLLLQALITIYKIPADIFLA